MIIHYYALSWCSYELYQERPAVFAPEDAEEELLRHYHFNQAEDGRYYKFLNEKEYCMVTENSSANVIFFTSGTYIPDGKSQEQRNPMRVSTANWLCIGSVLAVLIGIVYFFSYLVPAETEPELMMMLFPPVMWLTALILAVFVRIRCPESLFGKILLIIYIVIIVVLVCLLICFVIACSALADACFNCECIGSNMS
ncbi:MAG: hypothetical protein IJ644_02660 [Oscillospiraceae bacterium]|nr:hypothetical protein [Oscillospiraceae bacterium]